MKRFLAIALVLLVLPTCAGTERPEGIVERWLLALNQGSAGEPERYAPDELSEQVLAGWREEDPGQLDVVEVGSATEPCGDSGAFVPFRVVRTDGSTSRGIACAEEGAVVQVLEEGFHDLPVPPLPSEGGPAITSVPIAMWFATIAVGLALALVGDATMSLVRRSRD